MKKVGKEHSRRLSIHHRMELLRTCHIIDDDVEDDDDALFTALCYVWVCVCASSILHYVFKTRESVAYRSRAFMEKSERRGAKCECGMHAILADRN